MKTEKEINKKLDILKRKLTKLTDADFCNKFQSANIIKYTREFVDLMNELKMRNLKRYEMKKEQK